ncbi:hypothetical protein ACFQI3_15395 [Hansschlegelia quercus]|uniref:DUF3558 domain-containing protein n=1 Tax=Hansschlegelia quercus TaxID=2528245 RepID=A0A4V2JDD7_9HYPH|nr:hypothetical protein [Hansschlegelia quercus]TBN48275.1 hypothetical protein EYR15_14465 [Hansschlegelia quercus]
MAVSRVMIAAALFGAASMIPVAAPAAAQEPLKVKESIYTRHNYDRCPTRGDNGAGVARRACLGVGNIEIYWVKDDVSEGLWFGRRPITEKIDLGASYAPADTVEWRLDKTTGRPRAAIVKYRVGKSAASRRENRLVVYRLEPSGTSCLMAVIKEPGAAATAREAADAASSFRCGFDKRQGS